MFVPSLMCCLLLSLVTGDSHHQGRARPQSTYIQGQGQFRGPRRIQEPAKGAEEEQTPAERRTFLTVLLAAEVAYLEGVLAQNVASRLNSEAKKKNRGAAQGNRGQHHQQHQHQPHHPRQPRKPYQEAVTQKYVSQLDPFFMLDPPDLSAGGPPKSYNSAQPTPQYSAASNQRIELEAPPPPPFPTYGAYPQAPIQSAPQIITAAPRLKKEISTSAPAPKLVKGKSVGKWGDFELYRPGGYLQPPTKQAKTAKFKRKSQAQVKLQDKLKSKKQDKLQTKSQYRPSPASAKKYELPQALTKQVVSKSKPLPSPVEYIEFRPTSHNTADKKYNPSTDHEKVLVYKISPSKSAPSKLAYLKVDSTRGRPSPTLKSTTKASSPKVVPKKAVPSRASPYQPPITTYKPSVLVVKPTQAPYSQPQPQPKPQPQNHPQTFFHSLQAEQVHNGDWPSSYYNTIHKTTATGQSKVRRI